MIQRKYRFIAKSDLIVGKIDSLRHLPDGWHYGEGRGATQHAIDVALAAYKVFCRKGIGRIEVFPDVDGGILLSGYHEDETVEVLCGPEGSVNLLHEIHDEVVHDEDHESVGEVDEYVRELPWNSMTSSDLFTRSISVSRKADLTVWRSTPPRTAEVFQPWMPDAPEKATALSADMSRSITARKYQVNHPYFGGSTPRNYPIMPVSKESRPVPGTFAMSISTGSRNLNAEKSFPKSMSARWKYATTATVVP